MPEKRIKLEHWQGATVAFLICQIGGIVGMHWGFAVLAFLGCAFMWYREKAKYIG